jgi:hypothetical protein
MVTFVSLFLWLITGVQTVELAVDPRVDHVKILLDGEVVATINDAPWRAKCDFGPLLKPHELIAIAFGEDGDVIGGERQAVNLPRPEAETRIVLNSDEDGRVIAVRVVAQSADRIDPLNIMTTFDGKVIKPDKQGLYPLPDHNPKTIHMVRADASYASGVVASTDVSFGGAFFDGVSSVLTAVPVVVSGEPPTMADLEGRLTADGEELRVLAVEQDGVRIYLVRDVATYATLKGAGRSFLKGAGGSYSQRYDSKKIKDAPIIEYDLEPRVDRVHLVGVNATEGRGTWVFPISGSVSLERRSLPWAVTSLSPPGVRIAEQRLAEAVAVAGLRASGHGSPRAVLLVTTREPEDHSSHRGGAVRRYLDELGVPLYVWVINKNTETADWGSGTKTMSSSDITKASKALFADLEKQWIVWVEGSHLVNRIELDGEDLGISLAGSGKH